MGDPEFICMQVGNVSQKKLKGCPIFMDSEDKKIDEHCLYLSN